MAEKRKCPKCGAEVFASDDVCMDCGEHLAAARPVSRAGRNPEAVPERSATMTADEPGSEALPPLNTLLWMPPMRRSTRYPVLRLYQYVCMVGAWLSLLMGVVGTVGMGLSWAGIRDQIPASAGGLDAALIAVMVLLNIAGAGFWAFTLRAAVEAIQVYLDIEENTRIAAERSEERDSETPA